MATAIEMLGKRFGRLSVVRPARPLYLRPYGSRLCGNRVLRYWVRCDCGKEFVAIGAKLRSGRTKSCGCFRRDVGSRKMLAHGEGRRHSKTPEFRSYHAMLNRCRNPNNDAYSDYGGRGVKVCKRWIGGAGGLSGYKCFVADMGRRPSALHSLDRYPDNDGDYKPRNCRWATKREQASNRRKRRLRVRA